MYYNMFYRPHYCSDVDNYDHESQAWKTQQLTSILYGILFEILSLG